MTRRRRALIWVAAAFALACALLYPATPFGSHVLGAEDLLYLRPPLTQVMPDDLTRPSNAFLADAVEVFRPDLRWARDSVRSGQLPLWNARVFTGFPVLASQQTSILWPGNLPAFALPFADGAALSALLGIMLAALGAFALCRVTLRLGYAPAALAGVAYAAGAYLVSWLEHPHHNAWAVLPWALVAAARAAERKRARDVGWLAVAFTLLAVAGHPQSALMAGTLALAFGLYRAAGAGDGAPRPWRAPRPMVGAGARLAAGAALGVAAGAVVLLPFLELLTQSADVSRNSGPLPRNALLAFFLPELWGRPDWAFEGTGPSNYLERTAYFGVAPLALAAVALSARRRPRGTGFFAVAALVCLAVAVDTGPVAEAARSIPPFSLVSLARLLGPASLCLAVLGALGLEVLLRDGLTRRAALCGGAVLAVPLAWLALHRPVLRALNDFSPLHDATDQASAGAGAAGRWLLLAAVLVVLTLVLRRRRALLAAAIVALTALELVTLGHGFHPSVDRTLLDPPRTPGLELALAEQGSDRVLGDGEFLIPNADSGAGLRDPRGHGLPTLRRVQRLYAAYGGFGFQATRYFVDAPGADRLADAFGARMILTGWREADPPGLQLALAGSDERVYRNPTALSRAYLAWAWRGAPDEDRGRALTVASSTEELRERPVIEGVADGTGSGRGEASIVRDEDQRVTIQVTSDRPAQLVLLDSHYPGWQATVNGRPATIQPANGAFRAVAVPPGDSTVEFRYRPTSVYAGAGISAGAAAIILVLLLAPSLSGTARAGRLRRNAAGSR